VFDRVSNVDLNDFMPLQDKLMSYFHAAEYSEAQSKFKKT